MKTTNFTRKESSNFGLQYANYARKKIKTTNIDFLKSLFLSEKNLDVTKNFINSVLQDVNLPLIKAVQLHSLPPFHTNHKELFNLNVLDEKGQYYNLEIMNESDQDSIKRSLYFWAKRYTSASYDGKDFSGIMPTVSITLSEKTIFTGLNKFHWCFIPFDIQNRLVALDNHQQIHFLEIEKFKISKEDTYLMYLNRGNYPISENLFNWMRFFKEGWRKDFLSSFYITNPYIIDAKHSYEEFISLQN